MFHGHPNFHGEGSWRDWVLIDWGRGWGTLPSHIWCFVDLSHFDSGTKSVEYGGVRLENNVYAVVEVAQYDQSGADGLQSDLFIPQQRKFKQLMKLLGRLMGESCIWPQLEPLLVRGCS